MFVRGSVYQRLGSWPLLWLLLLPRWSSFIKCFVWQVWKITLRGKPSPLTLAHQYASFNHTHIFIIHLPLAMNYSTLGFPLEINDRRRNECLFLFFISSLHCCPLTCVSCNFASIEYKGHLYAKYRIKHFPSQCIILPKNVHVSAHFRHVL